MILIFSEKIDISTIRVIDLLISNQLPFYHITEKDKLHINYIDDYELIATINSQIKVDLNKCVIWNRHSYIFKKSIANAYNELLNSKFAKFYKQEIDIIFEHTLDSLNRENLFGWQKKTTINKLNVLRVAKKIGLKTPDTKIIGGLDCIDHHNYITKSISEIITIEDEKNTYRNFTRTINKKDTSSQSQIFPSLIQSIIPKGFDLRIFIFKEIHFSCLISTNNNNHDYRLNLHENNTYHIPYKIEEEIINRIRHLFNYFDLDCGSVDFIANEGSLTFLEINPEGQFNFMEQHCNYPINESIFKLIQQQYATLNLS